MCGIAGQFNFQYRNPVARETLMRMTKAIAHRGPDDEGYFIDGALGLGFRRLSIIDLAGGHQPMADSERKIWVIFNGEIYNYKKLRAELQSHGYEFQTNSDTEVIVHGYKKWGAEVLNRLNGMFGLAIWDAPNERLLVARDALGIKLVYYRLDDGQLTFGSEIRAILAADNSEPQIDPDAVNLFLRYRYTPSPFTIFRGIRKLAPGTMLIVEKGECREKRWYNFVPTPFEKPLRDEEAIEELLRLYKGAVERHLLADVPVGILLSGGLDSGLLLALMNENGKDWPAYTVGYGESFEDDELADATESAALLGSRHVQVRLNRKFFEQSLPKIVESLEEPIASSSIVPMYFVCQRAKQDVKVVIIGQGPDELFGGYKRHIGVHYGHVWRNLPSPIRGLTSSVISRLPRNETLKRGVASLATGDQLSRYEDVFSLAPARTIANLFQPDQLSNGNGSATLPAWREIFAQAKSIDELGAFQLLELRSSLPDELLMFADKLSMAHSLEGRVPYLDRTVVEFAQRLSAKHKVRNGKGKWIHREVCRKYLPPKIVQRKKRGFAVNVVDSWFNSTAESNLSDMLRDPDSRIYQILDRQGVRELLKAHESGAEDNHKLLFSLVMFEQWMRTQTEKQPALA